MSKTSVRFICNVCGTRAPEPILCVKPGCPTQILIYGSAYPSNVKQLEN